MKKIYTILTICILLSCCNRENKAVSVGENWIYNGSIEITPKLYQHEFLSGQDTFYRFTTSKDLYYITKI